MERISKEALAVVVIWYNPTQQQAQNIKAYHTSVSKIYIVDNSDNDNAYLAQGITNAVYMPNMSNLGVGKALNTGYDQAKAEHHKWIISFDQDSYMPSEQLEQFIQLCNECPNEKVGIYSPLQNFGNIISPNLPRYETRQAVMTSGSLMSTETYSLTGAFREEFFIDMIDYDYCVRVIRNGLQIIMVNDIVMEHHLGNGYVTVPIIKHQFVQHNALRHYYIVRNILYMIKDYPETAPYYRKQLCKRIKRLLLYDYNDKWHKIKMSFLGWRDYRNNKMYKCTYA